MTYKIIRRVFSSSPYRNTPQVCIVGAGPAGFYAAMHITKKLESVNIDILEKLPVPFGLIRYLDFYTAILTIANEAENTKIMSIFCV